MIRLKQLVTVTLGLVAAGVMVTLGIWQLNVYESQGAASARARAAQPAVALTDIAPPGQPVTDGYGRSVRFAGRYDPDLQLLVPLADQQGGFRVLSGLRQGDGSVVPVVRGLVDQASAPRPPEALVSQVGVLLPTEVEDPGPATPGQIRSVRIPALAQEWPGPLVGGFVVLSSADSSAQGLRPAPVVLPEGQGRLRNGAYALQWWLFAAFAVAMAARMARDFGMSEDVATLRAVEGTPGPRG
ncbi:MAG TPA: SURF1 family protein [Propionibacteriaceae bacterium]|nr:SURF1 family protein [Propionibacteriaceae bacterium]